MTRQEKQ